MSRQNPSQSRWLLYGSVVAATALILGLLVAQVRAGTSPVASDSLPPDKLAIQQKIDAARQQALAGTPPPRAGYHPLASTPDAPWPSGIIDSGQAPFRASQFTIQNQWQDVVNGQHVQVYAGALHDDSSQGIVVLRTMSLDLHTASSPSVFPTPSKNGAVRISAADGLRLTLTAADGTPFIFDVGMRQYVR